MLYSIIFTFSLVFLTFYLHFVALRYISTRVFNIKISAYHLVLMIVGLLFLLHILEIGVYSVAYYLLIEVLQVGSLHGQEISTFMEYFYYSAVMFTSLGLGDVYPMGHIRFITGIEALNGLLLISWSASFTFLIMKKFWPLNTET
ncbi:MAG: transporter [Legionellales bacterium]|nr:transporter [Legionellales bacterium]|tara:strand:- start:696 stop:1130 length:435 start_codon:yes stop_codon:yes gene_type:complete